MRGEMDLKEYTSSVLGFIFNCADDYQDSILLQKPEKC